MHYEMSEDAARELVTELARQQAQETAQVEQVPGEEPGHALTQPGTTTESDSGSPHHPDDPV